MTNEEILTLTFILSANRAVALNEIGETLHPQRIRSKNPYVRYQDIGRLRVKPLVDAGVVARVEPGWYSITEKGRIAGAILMTKDKSLEAAFYE